MSGSLKRASLKAMALCLGAALQASPHAQGSAEEELALATEHLGSGKIYEAIRGFQYVSRASPDLGPRADFFLTMIFTQMGQANAARRYLERSDATVSNPAAHFHQLGLILQIEGTRRKALGSLERALELGMPGNEADLWQRVGNLRAELLDPEGARVAFENAVETDPRDARAWLALGEFHLSRNAVDKAFDALRMAVELDPASSRGHAALGQIHLRLARDFDAAAEFRIALELDPADQVSRYRLARLLLATGSANEGRAELERYAGTEALLERARLDSDRAREYVASDDPEAAGDVLEDLARAAPGYPGVLHSLGRVLVDTGRYEEAIEPLLQAVNLAPLSWEAFLDLSRALQGAGRFEDARHTAERAVVLNEWEPANHRHLAQALLDSDRPEEAASARARAAELEGTGASPATASAATGR
jgi:tetratricopeptide (TPR) repeat protein